MESSWSPNWPSARRPDAAQTPRKKRKFIASVAGEGHPQLEPGSVNALSLWENNDRLEWTPLRKYSEDRRLVPTGNPVNVFPETRPTPSTVLKNIAPQRAEKGAHFLRTYYPDVEIAADVIRDELESQSRFDHDIDIFDPLRGRLIESIKCYCHLSGELAAFLVFPMGESNHGLNIFPLLNETVQGGILAPLARPIRDFGTPIYQIASASAESAGRGSTLAVRSLSSTSILNVTCTASDGSSPKPTLTDLVSIVRSNVGDRHVVDLKLSVSPQVTLVNDCGGVYKCSFDAGTKLMQSYGSAPQELSEGSFWRLASDSSDDCCLLSSSHSLRRVDFRSTNCFSRLWSPRASGELITCVEGPQQDHLIRLCTTTEIKWFDERNTQIPVLGYRHQREFDQSLEIQTVFTPAPLTILTSRRNGLLTVCDVSRDGSDGLVHAFALPYSLSTPLVSSETHGGHVFFKPSRDSTLAIFQLSERGSVHRMDCVMSVSGNDQPVPPSKWPQFQWSLEVNKPQTMAHTLQVDPGPLGRCDSTKVDFFPVYEWISRGYVDPADGSQDIIDETAERMLEFGPKSSAAVRHMLTTFDLSLRLGDDEYLSPAARTSKFFAQGHLNCQAGSHALAQGRIPIQILIKQALWHHNIVRALQHFLADLGENVQSLLDAFHEPNPAETRSKGEIYACEQLVVDLTLATDIFSYRPFSKPTEVDNFDSLETMSRAAEAMSLSNESPSVQFGYLRPLVHGAKQSDAPGSDSESPGLEFPLGVRYLLKEWDVGADPRQYAYVDSYEGPISPPNPRTKIPVPQGPAPSRVKQVALNPPRIVASSGAVPSVPPSNTQPPIFHRSGTLPPASVEGGEFQSSQLLGSNTQILPGRFGGGHHLTVKKPAKKRLGGF